MAIKLSVGVRNARLDSIETTISTGPLLRIYTGAAPAATTDAASGSLLATITLPSDWLAAASGGAKAKAGSWTVAASGTGTAGYFRVLETSGTTTHIQGTVTATGGGGDMTLDNTSIASGQTVTVATFTLTDGNA